MQGQGTPPPTTAHTPTPWELHGDGSLRICRPHALDPKGCRPVAEAEILGQLRPEAEANAAFIVRAVNNHESLVAALKANALRAHRWDSGHECNNQRFDDCHTIDCIAARAAIEGAKR